VIARCRYSRARDNSALLLGDPGRPVAEALERVRDWYTERGVTPRLAVPLPSMAGEDRIAG
jgi:hypothetical protein